MEILGCIPPLAVESLFLLLNSFLIELITGAFYVGNGWVAGGWDDEITSDWDHSVLNSWFFSIG